MACLKLNDDVMIAMKRSFGDVDLNLAIEQVNVESSADSDTVGGWVEDVADDLPIRERMVSDGLCHRS